MRLAIYGSEEFSFVELNTSGDNDTCLRCDLDSRYIDTEVFNLFVHCFEKSNSLYENQGQVRYNARNIIPLNNELIANLTTLESKDTIDNFVTFIKSLFKGNHFIVELEHANKHWKESWKDTQNSLIKVNRELIDITKDCIDNERVLWVIGY